MMIATPSMVFNAFDPLTERTKVRFSKPKGLSRSNKDLYTSSLKASG